jgi:hypothetical protein
MSKAGFEEAHRVRQAANDKCCKYLIANEMKCQPELVEGGFI